MIVPIYRDNYYISDVVIFGDMKGAKKAKAGWWETCVMNSNGSKDFWGRLDDYMFGLDSFLGEDPKCMKLTGGITFTVGDVFKFSGSKGYGPQVFEIIDLDVGKGLVLCIDQLEQARQPHREGHTDCTAYWFSDTNLEYRVVRTEITWVKESPGVQSGAAKQGGSNAQRQSELSAGLNSITRHTRSQENVLKALKTLRIQPELRADNPGQDDSDFEWPELPKFPADPIGPQTELFPDDDLNSFFEADEPDELDAFFEER